MRCEWWETNKIKLFQGLLWILEGRNVSDMNGAQQKGKNNIGPCLTLQTIQWKFGTFSWSQ